MKITEVNWTRFRLPLREVFQTATGGFTQREGILLRLATDVGIAGWGEASPHPALGQQGTDEALKALEGLAPRLVGAEMEEIEALFTGTSPALACALDTAACDALARARGMAVARLLSADLHTSVPVNAVIGAKTAAGAVAEAAAAREAGFPCVKLKVGIAIPTAEAERVAAVREALGPDIKLRLDANGAWSPEEAVSILRNLARFDLEMVEQPVPAADLEGLARVRDAVGVPIAADEAVANVEAARQVLERDAADVLVLKPMVVGGLRPARRIIDLAAEAGAECIVTTTIDAAVGTAAALHLAATLPWRRACGLATSSLLAGDLVGDPLTVRSGQMRLPPRLGLGVDPDSELLARFTITQGGVRA